MYNMKMKLLPLTIASLFVTGLTHAAEIYNKDGNKLNFYGKVDARHVMSDDTGQDGDATIGRLGFNGATQLNEQLSGYGQLEINFDAGSTESDSDAGKLRTRLAYAGMKFADLGSFDYGRNYGVLYDVAAFTDVIPIWGNDSYTYTDNYMTGRADGLATYRNTNFFGLVEGLDFTIQYQATNEGEGQGQEGTANRGDPHYYKDNGDGVGMSVTYDIGYGVSTAVAFSHSDRPHGQTNSVSAKGDHADAWTLGVKYDANDIYLAATYAETNNMTPWGNLLNLANKTQNIELVALYSFDWGLQPALGYIQSKGKDLISSGGTVYGDKDLVKYVEIGTTYYFNKNLNTYIAYMINLLDEDDKFYSANGINTDDAVGMGLEYRF